MHRRKLMQIGVVAALAAFSGYAYADEFSARLDGYHEIGPLGAGETGAILSNGSGTARLDVSDVAINYEITYQDLSTPVQQAHIHFGQNHVAGGVIVFFCTNLGNGPPGTPPCPDSGTVTGTWTADSVVGPVGQNIGPGDFSALLAALRFDTAYANIHTDNFTAGEIRGQVRPHGRDD